MTPRLLFASLALAAAAAAPADARVADARVERAAGAVVVTWTSPNPVDVLVADSPDEVSAKGRLAADDSRAGRLEVPAAPASRPYVLLRDTVDGTWVKAAERLVPLQQGSNFRDIGGYAAADGKRVRWGRIFRSGGTPLLTDADLAEIGALRLAEMVDLRSSEERVLAPSRIGGVRYTAVGYGMGLVMSQDGPPAPTDMGAAYRRFPALLTPQLRILFADLLSGQGPIAYNCSAGQDRTGFATAMILSALGVPRETIYADYQLSTTYRRPEWEMPRIDAAMAATSPTAGFFAQMQKTPAYAKPSPLLTPEGRPFLAFAFDEIEAKWGSVDAYLETALGVVPAEIARLRALYLE
jgi:protein-tyrosine phosphatase